MGAEPTPLARYATEVKREQGVGFSTRMGDNSGTVVVGRIVDGAKISDTLGDS